MNSKVSVVVTCYNHEKYIEECLHSIFAQSYQNIELFVFNDGSTDHSDVIISELLKESPFSETYYFSAKNRGPAFVRNEAIEKITGGFLLFVDSDNFLNSDHIEKLLAKLSVTNSDIAYCQLWDFTSQTDLLRSDLDYSLAKQLEGNLIDASSLVRTEKIGAVRFDEKLNHETLEDYDFWLGLIVNNSAKPVFVSDTKLNYRVLEQSRSRRGDWGKYYQSYFYIINKHREKIPQEIIQALQKNVLSWLEQYEVLLADSKKIIADKDAMIAKQGQENENLKNSKAFRFGNKRWGPFRK